MPFDALLNNIVNLVSKSGEVTKNIKAIVQSDLIFIPRNDIKIQSGDLIYHPMSNGDEEIYEVLDPNFNEKFHSIPAGYQLKVKKLGIPEAKKVAENITYNISGNNNRVNQNSTDNSINIIDTHTEVSKHINSLISEINTLDISQEDKSKHIEVVNEVQKQLSTEKPNKTIIKTLLSSLPSVANIATITALIISLI